MIAQTLTTSFKEQLLLAVHDFSTDTFKIALYTAAADLGPTTTVYTVTGEVTGAGYVAGGIALTGTTVTVSGTTAFVDFDSAVFSASVTTRGALIYNASKSNKAVAVLDFGADKTSTTTLTVTMPANTSTSALIRLP
jgi:VCBS repeat-containing protein